MNDYDSEIAELLEDINDESDDSGESDEERSRFRPFRPRVATGKGLYKARPDSKYVTQVQLQSALARVGGQIKAESNAIKGLSTRVNTLSSDIGKARKDLSGGRMMSILPLLLTKPPALKSVTFQGETAKTVAASEFEAPDIMPLVLIMMMSGAGGGDTKSGDDNMAMMLPMVLLLSQPKK